MDMITNTGYKPDAGRTIGAGTRQIHLLPRNPMDKTTIVSIYPREIRDVKPTLFPNTFVVPPALNGGFSLLIIEGASYFIPSPIEKQPPTEVQVNSMMLAESILRDSIPTMNLVSSSHRPGVFCIPGSFDSKSVLNYKHADGKTFVELLAIAKEWQMGYWKDIMDEADYFWSKSQGNPKTIPEDARMAAKILGVEKVKPWMSNVVASELVNCKACGEMINPAFPVCKFCHYGDMEKVKAMGLQLTAVGK